VTTGTLDKDWLQDNLPSDDRSVARRKLALFLAQDLRKIPYGHKGQTLGDRVKYPTYNDDKIGKRNESYRWFVANRGKVQNPVIQHVLGVLSVDDFMPGGAWS
jgi:hypothetical protein